jgi:aryl-alcohol dehydrogenase-like predicted oxidoreductase
VGRQDLSGFVFCQDEYSLLVRDAEPDLMPAMRSYGLGLLPYCPFASGLLTVKYRRNMPMPEEARLTQGRRMRFSA